jgi:hypothetical protein
MFPKTCIPVRLSVVPYTSPFVKNTSVSNKLGCIITVKTEGGGFCNQVNYRKGVTSATVCYKVVKIIAYKRAVARWLRDRDVGRATTASGFKVEMA